MRRILKNGIPLYITIAISLFASSCEKFLESDSEKQSKHDNDQIKTYITDHNIQAQKHSSGFYYEVLTANASGQTLAQNDVVDFYYKISLLDGTLLQDATSGNPEQVKLLNNAIAPIGLDEGISLMKVGEKFRFYLPSYLAYGSYSDSLFSPFSNFIVEVEVLKKEKEADIDSGQVDSIDNYVKSHYTNYLKFPNGLYFIDSVSGTGKKPLNGDLVKIDFTRKYLDGSVIRSVNGSSFYIGASQAVQGLELGIGQMSPGGKATLIMPEGLGFRESMSVVPEKIRKHLVNNRVISNEVLPFSIIQYDVTLVSVN